MDETFNISYRDERISEEFYPEHLHHAQEIVLFLHADIQVTVNHMDYTIGDGDILIINKNEIHKIVYKPGTRYCRYVMHIEDWFMTNILKALGVWETYASNTYIRPALLHTRLKERNQLKQHFEAVYDAFKNPKFHSNALINAEFKVNLAHLLLCLEKLFKRMANLESTAKSRDHVSEIVAYIDKNYMNPLTLDLLANTHYISKYHLSHQFRIKTGFSVMEYIQYRRIAEVQKMLLGSGKPTTRICYECGFNNIQHFYRVFKKITGMTPQSYKDKK